MADMAEKLSKLTRDDLLLACVALHDTLANIGNQVTSAEGDVDETERAIGLDIAEVIELAHDNMILAARDAMERPSIKKLRDALS